MGAGQGLLTEGSVAKRMLLFAIPIFFSNLFQQLYNAADSLIVGNFLGGQALAAVGSSSSLIQLMVGFINGVSLGAGVLIARQFGSQDADGLERSVHTSVALGFAAGGVLTVVGAWLTPQILVLMGTPPEVLPQSVEYFRVYFLGSIPVVVYNMGASILQSIGDSRSPMKYLIAASLTNIVLDLVFVAGFHWGVGSAAFATIVSQALCAYLSLRKLAKSAGAWRLNWRRIRFDGPMLRRIVALGVPSGVQASIVSLANVIVQSNINAFGANAMAGCGAYSKLEGFAFLPVNCFSLALSTFISQNIGANKLARVKKGIRFGLVCSPLLAEAVGLCIFLFAPVLIAAFNNEPDVLAYGVADARTVSLFYCLLAFSHCGAGIMRGMGKPVVPMVIMMAVWCVLRISYITFTVRLIPDIRVVYWAYPITWAISSLIFALCLTRMRLPGMDRAGHHAGALPYE